MKKTVLVTGATGFLGSHLVKALLSDGYRVAILKRSFSKVWRIDDVIDQVISFDIDNCDLHQVFTRLNNVFAIIHAATCYGKNNEGSLEVFKANTFFPLQLLDLAASFNTNVFINTDTYFNKGDIPYQGLPDYSISKKHFADWGKHYAQCRNIYFINTKLEHIFGGNEDNSKFTSYIVKSCLANIKDLALTEGKQLRDFIYVADVVTAYLKILEKYKQGNNYQEYELGSGQTFTIREFVETVRKLSQSQTDLNFGAIPYRENEIMFSKANIEQLSLLGWKPKYTLERGLMKTIAEYKAV